MRHRPLTNSYTICALIAGILSAAWPSHCWATLTITGSGFTNIAIPNQATGNSTAGYSYYYSNISNGVASGGIIQDGNGMGCPNAWNPNCHNPSDQASFSIVSNGESGVLYIFVTPASNPPQTTGIPLSSFNAYTVYQGTFNGSLTVNISFANLCQAYNNDSPSATALAINNSCVPTVRPIPTLPSQVPSMLVNFYLDIAGNGTFNGTSGGVTPQPSPSPGASPTTNATSDYTTVPFYVVSWITQMASATAGVGSFTVYPGDGEVYIQNPTTGDPSFPRADNGIGIQAMNFYYTTGPSVAPGGSCTTPSPSPGPGSTYPVFQTGVNSTTNGTGQEVVALGQPNIPNLTNGTTYYVVGALEDYADNVGYLTTLGAQTCAPADAVVGLLSKQGQCFIATAAWGTPMAEQVKTLRLFRDRYLMPHYWGRQFVRWYYRNSPPWAQYIRPKPLLRAAIRVALYPLVGFGWMAVHWGAKNACLMTAVILLLPLLFIRWMRA